MKALVALTLAAAAQQPQQFDLVCSGKAEYSALGTKAITRRYHVDLAAGRYCYDVCRISPIAEVTPDVITFEHDEAKYRGGPSGLDYVDRTTGKWSFYRRDLFYGDGSCTAAPFSGFPEQPTKF